MCGRPAGVARRSGGIGALAVLLVVGTGIGTDPPLARESRAGTPTAQTAGSVDRQATQPPVAQQDIIKFKSGIDLVNVTITVTDSNGRFVEGLTRDDFVVYEDNEPQPIAYFSDERVPVSLGIAVDTSGSMVGQKYAEARGALNRFLGELLSPEDEIFLYRFSTFPDLIQGWTTDRSALRTALEDVTPRGGTALCDTVAEAIPLAQTGQHRKKALVVISDGNDTTSKTDPRSLTQLIRATEVLVYAIGIDGQAQIVTRAPSTPRIPQPPRLPFPFPPGRGGRRPTPWPFPPSGTGGGGTGGGPAVVIRNDDRVNAGALRELTDASGGRTEIIRSTKDLDPATSGIANELSKQYVVGYNAAAPKDGRWHTIRVELKRQRDVTVRARKGYVATPQPS